MLLSHEIYPTPSIDAAKKTTNWWANAKFAENFGQTGVKYVKPNVYKCVCI